jgi:protein-S-isoprenylcysteine O-methyltransferase Ste14
MQPWRATLLLLALVCFCSFTWAIKGHFVSNRMSIFMHLTAALGLVSAGLQIFALFEIGNADTIRLLGSTLLYAASLALFWWTVSVTRSRRLSVAFSRDEPHHLLQTGPYRLIRHPFYSAYSLFWVAGFIAVLRWYLFPTVVVMLVFYFCAARMEEAKFENSELREFYEGYRLNTGMFLPRLRGSRNA